MRSLMRCCGVATLWGAAAVLTGCGGGHAEAIPVTGEQPKPAATPAKNAPANLAPKAEPVAEAPPAVTFGDAKVQLKKGKSAKEPSQWVVAATMTNAGTTPIDGLELVIELKREGEPLAERVHGTQVRFSPALAAGKSWPVTVSFVEANPKASREGVSAALMAARTLKPLSSSAWRPLDLSKTKQVSTPAKQAHSTAGAAP